MRDKPLILIIIAVLGLSALAFSQTQTLRIYERRSLSSTLRVSSQPEQDVLILTDEQGEYPLGRYVDILEDPGGELTIKQVTSPEYSPRFLRSQVDVPNYGYTDSVFWLRLRLRNQSSLTGQWLLETFFQNLNYVDLYIPTEGGEFVKKETGALRPFNTRDIPYFHIVFRLPLPNPEEQTIYIRVDSGSSMTLGFTLWSPETFAVKKINDMLMNGLFYGALLIVLGYHLFLLLSLKDAKYFYFILFLGSAILFFATYEGIADQYMWPGLSQEKRFLLVITMALFFMAALRFSDIFLEQRIRVPRLHHIINVFIGLWGVIILIVPFASYGFMAQITSIFILLTPIIAAIIGFYNWRKRYFPARFYIISWLGFILGLLSVELVRSGALPSTPLTEKLYHVGLIWLVLLWSLALADRINLLKRQTEAANRALRSSEDRLSNILEGLPLGVVVYGQDQKPNYANQRAIDILSNPERGIQPDLAAGRTLAQAMDYYTFRVAGSDQKYEVNNLPVVRALQGDMASVDDVEADLIDKRVPLEIWASPVKDDQGKVETAVVAFQDITRRKQAEAELGEYRTHLEEMVGQRTAELSAINEQLNREVAERKSLEEALHKRIEWLSAVNRIHQSIASPADLPEAFSQLSRRIIELTGTKRIFIGLWNGKTDTIDALCFPPPDGSPSASVRPLFLVSEDRALLKTIVEDKLRYIPADQVQVLPDPMGEYLQADDVQTIILVPMKTRQALVGLVGVSLPRPAQEVAHHDADLFERIALDLAYLVEDANLLEKSQALVANEERNRLARDLHDSVTQVLFSASLVAEVLPRIWQRDPDRARNSIDELRRLTHGALAEMRTMLLELRPASVTRTPLGELITQLTEAITSRSGLPFRLFIEQIPALPEDVHTIFYRIAQEGLNNVVKHAQAGLVTVSLSATTDGKKTTTESGTAGPWNGEVKLVIRDNGKGFSSEEGDMEHMGLGIMRERAASINAAFNINSQAGYGTELILVWHN